MDAPDQPGESAPPGKPSRLPFRFRAFFAPGEVRILALQMAVVLAMITLLSLGFYLQRRVVSLDLRQKLPRVVHGWDGLAWYIWVLAAPATLLLVRRYPVTGENRRRNLTGLALGSVAIYFFISNARFLLRMLPNAWRPDSLDRPWGWAIYFHTQSALAPIDLLTYCGFFSAALAMDYYFKYCRRSDDVLQLELRTAKLQSELARAQLAALRGQLHPHFLFNAFNAVSTLVRQRKNKSAVETIARLSDLLRMTISSIDHPEVTLAEELEFVRCYLEVERVRFGDKLRIELEVDPAAPDCLVPNMLLQPLVENAIKHGISRRVTAGVVRLEATRCGDRLRLEVADDGPGIGPDAAAAPPPGIGLRNTRERLACAYGTDYRLEIARRLEGGTAVRLDLPWRSAPVPAETALA